jgi:hypothetical protein
MYWVASSLSPRLVSIARSTLKQRKRQRFRFVVRGISLVALDLTSPRPLNAPSPFLNQRVVARHPYTQQPVKILIINRCTRTGMVAQQVESRSQFFRSQESVNPFVCSGGNFALLVAEVIQLPSGSPGIWSFTAYLFTGNTALGFLPPWWWGFPAFPGPQNLPWLYRTVYVF